MNYTIADLREVFDDEEILMYYKKYLIKEGYFTGEVEDSLIAHKEIKRAETTYFNNENKAILTRGDSKSFTASKKRRKNAQIIIEVI